MISATRPLPPGPGPGSGHSTSASPTPLNSASRALLNSVSMGAPDACFSGRPFPNPSFGSGVPSDEAMTLGRFSGEKPIPQPQVLPNQNGHRQTPLPLLLNATN